MEYAELEKEYNTGLQKTISYYIFINDLQGATYEDFERVEFKYKLSKIKELIENELLDNLS